MTDNGIRALGRFVADEAIRTITKPGDGHPALLVAGFDVKTIGHALRRIADRNTEPDFAEIIVKVGTSKPIDGVPAKYLLKPDEQLTKWRNRQGAALLLFAYGDSPDAQGLSAMKALNDATLLSGTNDADCDGFERFLDEAWRTLVADRDVPALIVRQLPRIWQAITAEAPKTLRRWADFLVNIVEAVASEPVYTEDVIYPAICKALPVLDLFPDNALFSREAALENRVRINARVSTLRQQPRGAEISEDDLIDRIGAAEFSDDALAQISASVQEAKTRMRELVLNRDARTPEARSQKLCEHDLALWLEVFEHRSKACGLGQQVREDLDRNHPSRVDEFNAMLIEDALDQGDQDAAQRLLDEAPPLAGDDPLADLLQKKLRRKLEKLAYPDSRFVQDPLRALLRELTYFHDENDGVISMRIEGATEAGSWSRWLFAFLYARTLRDIQDSTGLRLSLNVHDNLLNCQTPSAPEESDHEFDPAIEWAPLRFLIEMDGVLQRRFRWDPLAIPGQIALAAIVQGKRTAPGYQSGVTLDRFVDEFIDPQQWYDNTGVPTTEFARRLHNLREGHFGVLAAGLDAVQIDEYVEEWNEVIREARVELVPENAPNADLEAVVLTDMVLLANSRILMLATHPLKLRWLAQNLAGVAQLIRTALNEDGGLRLNGENEDLFFDAVDRVSPHGNPAVVVGPKNTVAIPMRESAGHEEYAPVLHGGNESKEWLSSVDETAIDEMVRVITDYLTTYPQKLDGLRVLLLDRNGDPVLPVRVAKQLRTRKPRVKVDLVVLAPQATHHEIIQGFDLQFTDPELSDDRFLPDVQLMLQNWDPDQPAQLDHLIDTIDIALAPALFGTHARITPSTKKESLSGAFDPWKHSASHNLTQSNENVARELLPHTADEMLESWSTLCVRYERRSPVSSESVDGIDFFVMRVEFDQHQELFATLHCVAHWVVTLDSFVGREQIDALPNRPDVILVKPSVGKNESYTLVVSSQTGRKFVVQALRRRLMRVGIVNDQDSEPTAARIYEVGRNVVPGAVLRSLGIGTTVNEIVGLVATRFVLEQYFPISSAETSLDTWISFDEHHRWFGRGRKTRADLGRFVLTVQADESVRLDVFVAESKFRQTLDVGSAEEQLDRTTDLCADAFRSGEEAFHDRPFWLDELAAAIAQTGGDGLKSADLPPRIIHGDGDAARVKEKILEALRSGRVELGSVIGVAVAIAATDHEPSPAPTRLGRHTLLVLKKDRLQSLIGALRAEHAPATAALIVEDSGFDRSGAESQGVSAPACAAFSQSAPIAELVGECNEAGTKAAVDTPVPESPQQGVGGGSARAVGLGDDELVRRYNRVADVFARHKVGVTAPQNGRWQEGPGFYILRFVPSPGVSVDKLISRRDEIKLALELEAKFSIRAQVDRGAVLFEVPKPAAEKYGVIASDLWQQCPVEGDRLIAPIGEDIRGNAVVVDLSSADSPHLLVAGTTGSGKSVALETILKGLSRYHSSELRLRLVDPKGTELVDFEGDPHLEGEIGMDAADAIEILDNAVEEMTERYKAMKELRVRKLVDYNTKVDSCDRKPWVVIVLDEYADLTSDPDEKKRIEVLLRRLTQKARAAGIHVITATQRPSADVISPTIRSNFPAQLALRVKTSTDSRIVLDETGAEALAGQGDALLHTARGSVRVQVAYDG
ncbi:DNA translocase FtsK [Saccharomonospora piscinae]|uniref:FtsK/SpoIIIE domain-containing protein n=1 Tax=Saccharomonospora piscinae TaxID=687388 RepID=UPI0011067393|nr:FtsK/SpoIIIE domain-containing protein [Saccharomonospora piscinae]TLW91687.1 DNA translocase FtsK [Saccharomonospora piscinae]